MDEFNLAGQINPQKIAVDSMERYSGSSIKDFGDYLLITNFPRYVDYFAKSRGLPVIEGSTFKVAHSPSENISILDFKMGSPMAALVVDLCAYLPIKGILMLGMAGGLRDRFNVGDYFVPVGSIRGDGTSDFYFPPEVPALGNFALQRIVTEVLEKQGVKYELGITHTTNRRFWEFNEEFKQHILVTRPQAIEMECATLFIAAYKHKVPLGALLLISDLPLKPEGIKTKESAEKVFTTYTPDHVEKGVLIIKELERRQNSAEGNSLFHSQLLVRNLPVAPKKKTTEAGPIKKTSAKKTPSEGDSKPKKSFKKPSDS
jgi:AMP nucleosidase